MLTEKLKPILVGVLSGVFITIAWFVPGTVASAVCGCISALFAAWLFVSWNAPYLPVYLITFIVYTFNFHWLFGTIRDFGGFSFVPSALIFALFAVLSPHRMLVCSFVYRNLPKVLDSFALRAATAWVTAEFIALRIFPWYLGHTQVSFTWLAQSADLLGAPLISFMVMWCAEAAIRAFKLKDIKLPLILPFIITALLCVYGYKTSTRIAGLTEKQLDVALVQTEAKIASKNGIRYFDKNSESYFNLTQQVKDPSTLIVWPETVIVDWVPTFLGSASEHEVLNRLPKDIPLLVGALTYTSQTEQYNSALGIQPDGTIISPYHKQILMPFGEYMPFGSLFPWLKEIHATPDFTKGTGVKVFKYNLGNDQYSALVSPLICYEDVTAGLGREAAKKGAELLVNISNDGWFGQTVAPDQHHLIGTFRAIENRRFLLRSTVTGTTAIVSPSGKTLSRLDPFGSGILKARVNLIDEQSPFTPLFRL